MPISAYDIKVDKGGALLQLEVRHVCWNGKERKGRKKLPCAQGVVWNTVKDTGAEDGLTMTAPVCPFMVEPRLNFLLVALTACSDAADQIRAFKLAKSDAGCRDVQTSDRRPSRANQSTVKFDLIPVIVFVLQAFAAAVNKQHEWISFKENNHKNHRLCASL